jgi:hypothetical protein
LLGRQLKKKNSLHWLRQCLIWKVTWKILINWSLSPGMIRQKPLFSSQRFVAKMEAKWPGALSKELRRGQRIYLWDSIQRTTLTGQLGRSTSAQAESPSSIQWLAWEGVALD